jgi:heme/copper-type cytochrome/quinol oxidase subunit 3
LTRLEQRGALAVAFDGRTPPSSDRLLDAKVKGSRESGTGGCGMWVWIVGASVVFAVPFFTFAWKTK